MDNHRDGDDPLKHAHYVEAPFSRGARWLLVLGAGMIVFWVVVFVVIRWLFFT